MIHLLKSEEYDGDGGLYSTSLCGLRDLQGGELGPLNLKFLSIAEASAARVETWENVCPHCIAAAVLCEMDGCGRDPDEPEFDYSPIGREPGPEEDPIPMWICLVSWLIFVLTWVAIIAFFTGLLGCAHNPGATPELFPDCSGADDINQLY